MSAFYCFWQYISNISMPNSRMSLLFLCLVTSDMSSTFRLVLWNALLLCHRQRAEKICTPVNSNPSGINCQHTKTFTGKEKWKIFQLICSTTSVCLLPGWLQQVSYVLNFLVLAENYAFLPLNTPVFYVFPYLSPPSFGILCQLLPSTLFMYSPS